MFHTWNALLLKPHRINNKADPLLADPDTHLIERLLFLTEALHRLE